MARAKGKQKSTFHDFTMLHNEFIDNTALNAHEKLVFIAIKRHLNKNTLQAFPSLTTISKHARISKRAVQRAIETLTDKGIIEVEHRKDKENNGNRSNEYTLYDYKSMWIATSKDEMKQAIEQEQELEILENLPTESLQRKLEEIQIILERRNKEKGLEATAPTKVTADSSLNNNNMYTQKDTTKKTESQDRYSMEQIQQLYDYDILLQDNPDSQENIDAAMSVLLDALNTKKETIRIAGEKRPAMSVISKLMKLTYLDIAYALEKFSKQTGRVKNPAAYLLTILYSAKEQSQLDATNRVAHDLARGKAD